MKAFESEKFIDRVSNQMTKKPFPPCRFCGGNSFTTTDSMATILIGKDLDTVSLGPSIPAGMVICKKCGHIEFFALGALGMLPEKEEK